MAESRQLSRFTATFALGTLLSRVLGLVRDKVWFMFIDTTSLGPFLLAWKFPNMLRDLIGEGAANAAFIPVLSDFRQKESTAAYREAVSAVMSAMFLVLLVLTVAGVAAVPLLLYGSRVLRALTGTPPLDPDVVRTTALLSRWIFPYLFFIGMAVFAMGPLFIAKHYATPSWSPVLLNAAFIASCLLLHKRFSEPAYALVVGAWLGGAAQLVANYVAMGRRIGVWRPNFHLRHPAVRASFCLLIPVLLGQATAEVNKLVDALFALRLGPEVIKALYTANRLVQLPLSMFGMAMAAAVLPAVSRAGARGDFDEIRHTLMQGLRQCFFLVFPAMIGLILLRTPIIRLLFEGGRFTAEDTARAAGALGLYGAGLLSFAWVKVAVSGFYAVKNTKTPVIVASSSMFLNILLNCVLVGPLGYRGLALATTISFTVNFLLLYLFLSNRFGALWDRDFLAALFRMVLATGMMAAVVYGVHFKTAQVFPGEAVLPRAMCVALPMVSAAATYIALAAALDLDEFRAFASVLRRTGR